MGDNERCAICGCDIKVGDTCYFRERFSMESFKYILDYVCITCGDQMGGCDSYLDKMEGETE